MIAEAPSPTRSRTRPDYAREIWENGFRAEAERVAIELNKEKAKTVDTTRAFWESVYSDYIVNLAKKSKGEKFDQVGFYDTEKVRDGVWHLLHKHFSGSTISVRSSNAERSGSTGKVVGSSPAGRSLVKDCKIRVMGVLANKLERQFYENGLLSVVAEIKGFQDKTPKELRNIVDGVCERYAKTTTVNRATCKMRVEMEGNTLQIYSDRKQNALIEMELICNDSEKKPLPPASAPAEEKKTGIAMLVEGSVSGLAWKKKEPLRTPIAQALFGNPDEVASLAAFCDAQLQLLKPGHQLAPYYAAIKQRLLDARGNDVDVNRYCDCGCGKMVVGNKKRRFFSEACRVRKFRAGGEIC